MALEQSRPGGKGVVREGVLAGVGGTPLIELRRVVPPHSARVLVKLEWANPSGSMTVWPLP